MPNLPPFVAIAAIMPIDAVLTYEQANGEFTCSLHQRDGTKHRTVSAAGPKDTIALFTAVTAFLADEIGIDRAASPLAGDMPTAHPELVELCYLMRLFRAEWIDNSGDKRLDQLRPHLKHVRTNPFAAAVMNAATWMSLDRRKVPKPAGNVMLARQALPVLLVSDAGRGPVATLFAPVSFNTSPM